MHVRHNVIEIKYIKEFREVNHKRRYEKGSGHFELASNILMLNSFDYHLHCQKGVNIFVRVNTNVFWCILIKHDTMIFS